MPSGYEQITKYFREVDVDDGFAMIRLRGRKILRVFYYCFVSFVFCGVSVNTSRSEIYPLLSNPSHHNLHDFDAFISSTLSNKNATAVVDIAQGKGLPSLFSLNYIVSCTTQHPLQTFTSLDSQSYPWLALGYFILDLNPIITQSV